jgi:tyrosine-protein kinase Etk/Wzc
VSQADLEFTDVSAALRRGLRRIAVGALVGAVLAVLVIFFAPARFSGRAMLLVRTDATASSLVAGQLGALGDIAGGALGLGDAADRLKTELALLRSRALLGDIVDSLRLQVRAGRVPGYSVPVEIPAEARFAPRKLAGGEAGTVKVVDREDAIDDLDERLDVRVIGGETVEIRYAGRDSLTAAAVPNLIAARYMERRRTVDRGLNQRRVEFLEAQADSVRDALREAAGSLRSAQEGGRVVSLELAERAEVEGRIALQARLGETEAEFAALERLIAEVGSGDPRRLAGFPALLRSPAVNELVSEMARLGTERALLRADATERAPRVVALDSALAQLRSQVLPLARTYAQALDSQREAYREQIASSRARSASLPRAAESLLLREAEVEGLGRLALAVEAQLLDARLAALGEGGDVRVVDAAVVPRKVSFPRKLPTLAVGLLLGLAFGTLAALVPLGAPRDEA